MTRSMDSGDEVARVFPLSCPWPFTPPSPYLELQDTDPVCPVATYEGSALLVTRYADVREALAGGSFSADLRREGYPVLAPGQREAVAEAPPTIAGMDGAEHATARRSVQEEFSTARVRAMEPHIRRIVDGALDEIERQGPPVDLVTALALPVPSAVVCMILGIPYEDHGWFNERTATVFARDTGAADRMAIFTEIASYLDTLIAGKENDPPDDLLGRQIVERRRLGRYVRSELVSLANLLLIAGHETTASMITVSVARLLVDDDLRRYLAQDHGRIPAAIEEFLRYYTVAQQALMRVASEDTEIGGVPVQAGSGVLLSVQVANRDPRAFPEPDEFRVGQGRGHLAFGHGPHQCVGAVLARTELRVVLDALLRRRSDLRLERPVEELSCRESINVCGLEELPVTW